MKIENSYIDSYLIYKSQKLVDKIRIFFKLIRLYDIK